MVITSLRIDEKLYDELIKVAVEEERSINSMIIYIIKKYLENK